MLEVAITGGLKEGFTLNIQTTEMNDRRMTHISAYHFEHDSATFTLNYTETDYFLRWFNESFKVINLHRVIEILIEHKNAPWFDAWKEIVAL